MKWAFSSMGLVAAGLVGIVIVLLFQNITVNNEQDYYLLKEVAEAAMLDSIDLAYYRDTGEVKMIQEKFVENFTRRYAETVNVHSTTGYTIEFYDIMEEPPKVSILIKTGIGTYTVYGDADDYNIANQLDAILEADDSKIPQANVKSCKEETRRYYSIGWGRGGNANMGPTNVVKPGDNYKISSVNYVRRILTSYDFKEYNDNYSTMYGGFSRSRWSINENTDTRYIAKDFSIKSLSANNSNQIRWSATYECGDKKSFSTDGGETGEVCLVGIIYDVVWKEYKNCE